MQLGSRVLCAAPPCFPAIIASMNSREKNPTNEAKPKRRANAAKPEGAKKPGKAKKVRLDQLLVERGVFADADEALRWVMARKVRVDDAYATSAAVLVRPDADVFVRGRKQYVSRGGLKLQGALDAFGQDVSGMRCLDIGSSTGGFTDCLLQAGAASVACVDVNYGQLAWKLRQDARVTAFERTNIREADPQHLGAPFDLIVIDVSFIGLAALAEVFPPLCHQAHALADGGESQAGDGMGERSLAEPAAGGESRIAGATLLRQARSTVLIGLIKPQFESRHEETDRGIVRDESVRRRTVEEVRVALENVGFAVSGVVESPIHGAQGNVEYLVRAVFCGKDVCESRRLDAFSSMPSDLA